MATELGKAYVQIMPSAKGISGEIEKTLGPEAEAAGKGAGGKLTSALKGAITVAAIGKFFAESIKEGAALQQSLGGVETLFKDHADKVKASANEAYKTVGISANDYMENVTSFSASLLQSVAGDTSKAADIADMAMIDMSDNANKFGSNMQDIQNAYQGFAKQNYTMLDNLKLGYGGTKTEMERLLKDAQAFSGVEYNIDSLSDVYEAIHVIQEEMGVAGTTALEASETFSGSFAAMKSAFQNTLGALALGENILPALQGLGETISTFLFGNLIPMVLTIIQSLIPAVSALITTGVPQLLSSGMEMIQSLSDGFLTGLPQILDAARSIVDGALEWFTGSYPELLQTGVEMIVNFANGLMSSIPTVLSTIGDMVGNILSALFDVVPKMLSSGYDLIAGLASGIMSNLPAVAASITNILSNLLTLIINKGPDLLRSGVELIAKLATGLWNNLPQIITTANNIVTNLLSTIASHMPQLMQKGFELLGELAKGLIKAIPGAVAKVPQIVSAILSAFRNLAGGFINIGSQLIRGIATGIGNAAGAVVRKAREVASNILSSVKGFFGIKSPSRVFMEIGENLDAGLAKGIEGNSDVVSKAMDDITRMTTGTMESEISIASSVPKTIKTLTNNIDANAQTPKQSANMTFVLQGHRFKAFVDDITKLQDRDIELELAY